MAGTMKEGAKQAEATTEILAVARAGTMMQVFAAMILLSVGGASFAQTDPRAGATQQRDGAQPAGTVLQPQGQFNPQLQPPPQNPQPFGGSVGGPIQETGNYGNLGLGASPGQGAGQGLGQGQGLVQPDYRNNDEQTPFQRR